MILKNIKNAFYLLLVGFALKGLVVASLVSLVALPGIPSILLAVFLCVSNLTLHFLTTAISASVNP